MERLADEGKLSAYRHPATGRTWTASATRWCWRSNGPRASRRGRSGERDRAGLQVLLGSSHADLRRPRALPARQLAARRRGPRARGAALPAARVRVRRVPARPARGVRLAAGHLRGLRLLLVLLRQLGRARSPLRRADDRALRLRRRLERRRARLERRLPAPVVRRARRAGARRRAGGQRGRGRRGEGHSDDRPLLRGGRPPATSSARGAAPTS